MKDIEYCSSTGCDLPAIQTLLADCHLPTDGIELLTYNCLVAKDDSKIVGTVALEPCGRSALLRLLAVAPDYRGRSLAMARIEDWQAAPTLKGGSS